LEFIQRLAQQSYISTHPLILYSGQVTPELEQQVRALGVYAVLQKPYNLQDLLSLVRQACESPEG
ncbi:MAG TPA: hypothetical protein PKK23_15840, partial [Nitrospirales bacterium]|nr:hypothetical protein [Nitrospirales bacterium]